MEQCLQDVWACVKTMSISDGAVWIQTILIIFGFGLAYKQFRRWREEIIHDRRIDFAMKIYDATYRYQEGFRVARDFSGQYKRGFDEPQPNWQDVVDQVFGSGEGVPERIEYDHNIRAEKIKAPMMELASLLWQSPLIFKPDQNKDFGQMFEQFSHLYSVFIQALYDVRTNMVYASDPDRSKNIAGAWDAKDREAFQREIDAVTRQMRDALTVVTQGKQWTLSEAWNYVKSVLAGLGTKPAS